MFDNLKKAMDRIEVLKDWLIQDPSDNFVQHALAMEYVKRGLDQEARKLLESLLERDSHYVGSYYHLAKILERGGEKNLAIRCYEDGMREAKQAGDQHAWQELRSALDELNE